MRGGERSRPPHPVPAGRSWHALAAVALLLSGGCVDDEEDAWYRVEPSLVHRANGFSFAFYGPRSSGWAPDVSPALDGGTVTLEELGLAFEERAVELAARAGIGAGDAVAALRGLVVRIVDDSSFELRDGVWCSGMLDGGVCVVALWSRIEVPSRDDVPQDAAAWMVRAPDAQNEAWRYGTRPLVPALDHELGHWFFGPSFEH